LSTKDAFIESPLLELMRRWSQLLLGGPATGLKLEFLDDVLHEC
jgi:hypothetical protein